MPRLTHTFNVMLTNDLHRDLGLLALAEACSKGQVVRNLIAILARMRLQGIPYCATGQQCFTPHLHPAKTPITSTQPAKGDAADDDPNRAP